MNIQELDLVIIKHLLTSKTNALEFINECDEKLFATDLWKFSKIIIDYTRTYREVPTRKVINERLAGSKNESILKYINSIWDDVDRIKIDEKEYKHDLEKLKNRFLERLVSDLKDHLVDENGRVDLKKSIPEISAAITHIKAVNQVRAYEQKTLRESLENIRSRYIMKQKDPSYNVGLKTGLKFFDELTNGLMPSEMLIIAGPTAGGKSILLSQTAQNMWMGENTIDMEADFKKGCDVLYFSLEMPMEHCLERICANMAKVPQTSIRDATLDDEQKQRMGKALKFIERYPYELTIIDAPRGLTPTNMEIIYNNIVEAKGKKPEVVVIDYLALMEWDEPGLDDWLKQGRLSEAVSEFGRAKNVNVITAVQMTDDGKPGTSSVGTHRLSRSKMIGHNANFILMIEKRQNEAQRPDFQLHLIKSRRSALAVGTLYKNLECCSLNNEPSGDMAFQAASDDQDISDVVD